MARSKIEIHKIRRSRSNSVGRKAKSNFGFIPAEINSSNDVKMLSKQMNMNNNQKQEVIDLFLAITAKWCGACHQISDRLNKAVKKSKRPASRIDETLVKELNNSLNSSIEPPHYPYFIVINSQGGIVKILDSIEDVEAFLKKAPSSSVRSKTPSKTPSKTRSKTRSKTPSESLSNNSNSATLTNNSANSANSANSTTLTMSQPEEEVEEEDVEEIVSGTPSTRPGSNMTMKSIEMLSMPDTVGKITPPANSVASERQSPNSGSAKQALSNSTKQPLLPTNPANDLISRKNMGSTSNIRPNSSIKGGCLYTSLATTAYQLAPPAVLLGLAAATLRKTRKGKKRVNRKSRKNLM